MFEDDDSEDGENGAVSAEVLSGLPKTEAGAALGLTKSPGLMLVSKLSICT